ncbi:transglutaminaseTgpA domain-containing protein [Amycolatopsis sp.]|uniref:transglutaminase family protein n=1 Tax=Amycolatopsis sp. TaxID=37632 RepID=UPI002D7E41C5|nr:transglutaminaseTgpA domain-containing protein [Amycolatopsis sp.]HET6708071.1 transglutaminaseTgpA domain-containing protein [Amycolatopsis sp.]
MSTAAPPRRVERPAARPERPLSAWRSSVLAPVAAGVATLCAATSVSSVVAGLAWFGYLFVAVLLIGAAGLALRSLQVPTILVGLGQLLVLLFLITGAFTTHGILQIIPGPEAFSEIGATLTAAAEQIRVGLPPVEGSQPILCLVTILIGLVAVLVDTLTVAAAAPAATGLVLLCVYAVPAALSDEMLPWWTFLLGAAAFAGLLAVDGNHRHRRWRTREAPGRSGKPGVLSAPVAVVSAAIVLGLTGGAITWVGTVGSMPFSGKGNGAGSGSGGFGIQPFTELRGMLDQGANRELFKVRGLGTDRRLMRAMTLDTYYPNKGWGLHDEGRSQQGVPVGPQLPPAPGDDGTGTARRIDVEPTSWRDNWLPVYGAPRVIDGAGNGYLYDQVSGTVFTTRSEAPPAYTEYASLKEPTAAELRVTPRVNDLPPRYTQLDQVDERVRVKTEQLIAGASNDFDRASAIWRYFTAQNGFVYDTKTTTSEEPDALADFILNGKRGFCEQFASAMGVMLRVAGIPSRVAIGFTPGVQVNDYLSISTQDAHAWVEAYFGDKGWVTFDPTPLSDGRGITPPYLQAGPQNGNQPDDTQVAPSTVQSSAAPTGVPRDNEQNLPSQTPKDATGSDEWLFNLALLLAALGAGALFGAALLRRMLDRERANARKSASRETVPQSGPSPGDRSEGALLVRAPAPVPTATPSRPQALLGWLPLLAVGLWITALGLLAATVAWWLGVLVVVLLLVVAGPAMVREAVRRRRLQRIVQQQPGAADAAWAELRAECADRGLPIPSSDTVRVAGQKLAAKHHLDDEGREDLRTIIGVLERSWYGEDDTPQPELPPAFEGLRRSLRRNAPLSWKGKLFPRSVFRNRT